MPRLAANITFLFPELDILERPAAAAAAGFEAVEILFPYDLPVPALRAALDGAEMPLVLFNAPPPNYAGGTPGFAALPAARARFRRDFARARRYAAELRPAHLHLMAGPAEGAEARATFVDNLRWAAAEAPELSLTIEPINRADMPGYYLSDFGLAAEIIAEVGAPNLGLQFDAYHAHRITGDVAGTWARCRHLVRHVQIADHPGRHEPGTGEIDLEAFLDRLDADGYAGFVSAEYHPRTTTAGGLGWLARLGRPRKS